MIIERRAFLLLAAGTALAAASSGADPMKQARFKAIAFDGFAVFDPRPVAALAEALVPGKGQALMAAWRTRQFEYQWLRALSGRYADFLAATRDSLAFASKQLQLELPADQRDRLVSAYAQLPVWPDVPGAIKTLHDAGLRLSLLSNMTSPMMAEGLGRAGLGSMFDDILSTDRIHSYKPDPRAYRMGVDKLKLPREEILFAAFAGWDVAGAKWFGYPTFWVNRLGSPREELGVDADASGPDLNSLVGFVLGQNSGNQ